VYDSSVRIVYFNFILDIAFKLVLIFIVMVAFENLY